MKLRVKIVLSFVSILLLVTLGVSIFLSINLNKASIALEESSTNLGNLARDESQDQLKAIMMDYMRDLTKLKAYNADSEYADFASKVENIAINAEDIYFSDGVIEESFVDEPDPKMDNELSVQMMHSASTDMTDPDIIHEAGLVGNIEYFLYTLNDMTDHMASNYFATETGIMIQCDYIAGSKIDEDGNVKPYEAHTRPWYIGAKETGDVFFTPIISDVSGGGDCMICSCPVYDVDGVLKGVAGAGMYISGIEDMLINDKIVAFGDAFVINSDGQIVFSSIEDGLLSVKADDDTDIRTTCKGRIRDALNSALAGVADVRDIVIDDKDYYMAFAPMKTVGWSYCTLVPREEVLARADLVGQEIDTATDKSIDDNTQTVQTVLMLVIIILAVAFVISIVISIILSRSIAKPINELTKKVKNLSGDNLDFEWNMKTSGETEVLAESFGTLTESLKKYITEITEITAEKERIGAELNVATKIQADMLPSIFPAFPDRCEFDLRASMDPAKEVGGDFYDFFMIDDTHLGLVMADVSGKGVPAALFMVISKTLLKNTASHGLSPAQILAQVNNLLCEGNVEMMFVTVWLGILDLLSGEMVYANAGHEYPAVSRAGSDYELIIEDHDIVLAAMEDMPFREFKMKLEPGDMFFIYTDGVPEATSTSDELFGVERMLDSLNRNKKEGLADILVNLRNDIDEFAVGAPQFDDITMLVLEYKGMKNSEFVVPASDTELAAVQGMIDEELEKFGCDIATQTAIDIAIEEIFVNICHYAYEAEPDESKKTATVRVAVVGTDTRKLIVDFIDSGIPYNPLEKADPDITLSAEERGIGGLGIYMVKQSMDDVRYEYVDGQNKLTIEKILK